MESSPARATTSEGRARSKSAFSCLIRSAGGRPHRAIPIVHSLFSRGRSPGCCQPDPHAGMLGLGVDPGPGGGSGGQM